MYKMNGMVLVKTQHPLENIMDKITPINQIGFIVRDQVFMIDNWGIYDFPVHRGIFLQNFKSQPLIKSISIRRIKVEISEWIRIMDYHMEFKPPSLENLIGSFFGISKIVDNQKFVMDILQSLELNLEEHFEDWEDLELPERSENAISRVYQETLKNSLSRIKVAVNIFIDYSVQYGLPTYHFDTPYKQICIDIFELIDSSIKSGSLNLDRLENLRSQFNDIK